MYHVRHVTIYVCSCCVGGSDSDDADAVVVKPLTSLRANRELFEFEFVVFDVVVVNYSDTMSSL